MVKPPPKLQGHPFASLLITEPELKQRLLCVRISKETAHEGWTVICERARERFADLSDDQRAKMVAAERSHCVDNFPGIDDELMAQVCEEVATERIRDGLAPNASLVTLIQLVEIYGGMQ